ncbi:MAG: fibronectin type III domain-containing protein, partial [Actinomycetota bacterium]
MDVVANDQDTLGQGQLILTNAFLSGSGAGTVSHDDRSITFVSDPAFFGDAQVRYTISDGREGSGGDAEGILTVRVLGRPSAPSGVSATAVGPTNVVVSWLAPPNNGAPIESYTIRVNGSETVVHNSTTPQYRFDDRTPGQSYAFEVLATNQAGDGTYSVATAPVVPDEVPGPPGRPTVAIVPGVPGQLEVTWGEGPNAGSAINEYQLELGGCGSTKIPVGPGGVTTVYTWQGLQNGTPCTFRASAVNRAGEGLAGPWSDQECPADVPGAPNQPAALRGDRQATVNWAAPTNPDCQPLVGYEILRYRNGALDGTT